MDSLVSTKDSSTDIKTYWTKSRALRNEWTDQIKQLLTSKQMAILESDKSDDEIRIRITYMPFSKKVKIKRQRMTKEKIK